MPIAPALKPIPTPLELPEVAEPAYGEQPVEQTGPRFVTHLKLPKPREEWLCDRASQRIAELMEESGLEDDGSVQLHSWMGRRCRYQDTYDNDLSWRQESMKGSVFEKSNLTLGTTKRYVREMSAKVTDDLLGTSPFFAVVKRKETAGPLAKAVDELLQERLSGSNLQQTLREAIRTALVRNEAVVKIRHEYRPVPYVGPAEVLCRYATGQPVVTPGGQFIYRNDDMLEDPNMPGLIRLKKDPLFAMTSDQQEYVFKQFDALAQTSIACDGPEARVLDNRSFLCPLRAPDIHKSDINVHLYDDTIENLRATYGGFEVFEEYAGGFEETSGEMQPKTAHGEVDQDSRSSIVKRRRIAEVYIRCDADEDGAEEEIMLVLDRDSKTAVFYEYLQNQMPKRPFEVIVGVETVPNRWYGVGVMQMLEDNNNYIDAQFNRINLKDSNSGSITFRNPHAVKDWKAGLTTEIGTDRIYDVEQGFDSEHNKPIWRESLMNETSQHGWDLMQKAEQAGNLQFGVISAKDASVSNMNQSRTATGILNLERTANVLTKATETDQVKGIEAVLEQAIEVVLENLKEAEMFFSKDGMELHSLSREEIRGIEREVKLLMTRSRSTEMLAVNQQVLQIAKDYFATKAQNPEAAKNLRPVYVQSLKSLECADADEFLPPVTDEEIAAWKQAMSQPPPSPPRDFIQYKDTPPSIQRQMEAESGFEPASDEERAAWQESQKKPAPKAPPKS